MKVQILLLVLIQWKCTFGWLIKSIALHRKFIELPKIVVAVSLGLTLSSINVIADEIQQISPDNSAVLEGRSGTLGKFTGENVLLPSGLRYYDAVIGNGDEVVKEGSTVQFQWVLRRSNGYFVDSSKNYGDDEVFIYKVGNQKKIKVIEGIDQGIRGMKVGGVRRLNIPPELAYVNGVNDDSPGPVPASYGPRRQIETRKDREIWYMEIKVTKIKNS